MAKKTAPLFPATELQLQRFGERLRLARLRRRLTGKQVADRAGMTPVTLRSLERGSSGVTMGAYLAVMQVLGAEKDLDLLLQEDALGRNLQDAALPRQHRRSGQGSPAPVPKARRASRPASTSEVTKREASRGWKADDSFVSVDSLASLIEPPKPDRGRKGR
jgi:transcriptional regulator with XRE-family HTH domain